MLVAEPRVNIQGAVPFSKSKVWEAQREYYDSQGIEAWSEQVPFYVTSNPLIADHYARIVLKFFQDAVQQNPEYSQHTFYVIELGAGTGQFSYYVLKRMLELMDQWAIQGVSFCYVISDFTQNNVSFWQNHQLLRPFVDRGVVDFAMFDLEHDCSIRLLNSQVELCSGSEENPLTVIANYLFDSVVADVFRIHEDELQESLVDICIDSQFVHGNRVDWPKASFNYTNHAVGESYYQHAILDQILSSYRRDISHSYVQIPVGGIRGLETLAAISSGKLFLISSDKGHVSLGELEDLEQPELAFHGSFSTMVNFHAIAEFFRLQNGGVYLQELFDAFATGAFSLGFDLSTMPNLMSTLKDTVGGFAPGHYYHLYDQFDKSVNKASLESIAAMLNLSRWDPAIFELASDRISSLMEDADIDVVKYLSTNLPRVVDHYYFIPGTNDVLFDIGVFYQENEEFAKAVLSFERSLTFFPESYEVLFNLGYCHFELKQFNDAMNYFKQALQFQPKSKELKKHIAKTQQALV